jgi:hypothetical protein
MALREYFMVSALPSLGDLGSPPPLALEALREHVAPSAGASALVDSILLADDLVQRESLLTGETSDAAPAVLTTEQVRGEAPLPPELAATDEAGSAHPAADAVWEAYFRHAAAVARRRGSPFAAAWTAREVALRNALVAARAKALGFDATDYLVAPDVGAECDDDFTPVLNDWVAAANPLEGLRVLDQARWTWLAEHDGWFSFADDEVAAYAAKLMLLVRWHRLAQAQAGRDA